MLPYSVAFKEVYINKSIFCFLLEMLFSLLLYVITISSICDGMLTKTNDRHDLKNKVSNVHYVKMAPSGQIILLLKSVCN